MKKILLVDDERWVRTALKWTINKLNLPLQVIHECENGLEALDWIKQNDVDLVLTDIRMPIMDGLSFVKELDLVKERDQMLLSSVFMMSFNLFNKHFEAEYSITFLNRLRMMT